MNLILFLKQVDAVNAQLSKERLAEFVHEWGRRLPESQRNEFLEELSKGLNTEHLPKLPETPTEAGSPPDECADMLADLERIATGDLQLTGQFNEQYDDWYDDSEELLYEDPHGVGETIDNAIDLAHKRMDMEDYGNAYALGNALLALRVSVEDDGEYDYDVFSLFDMKSADMISGDLRPLILETICAAYLTVSPEQRPDTLYRLFELSNRGEVVSLEDALQSAGKELPEIRDFLKSWVAYLGGIKGQLSRRLFEEAAFLRDDRDALIRAASDYADTHPGLYERILLTERETENAEALFTLGQEALTKLRPTLTIRSRIALLTAENALRMGNQDAAEQCWLEAFRSNPTPLGYLRLCTESRDFSRFRDEVRTLYRAMTKEDLFFSQWDTEKDELSENGLSRQDFHTLNFLDGDFPSVLSEGMNVNSPLGWSGTFMKRGMTLFLLYLYRGEHLESGLHDLCGQMIAGMRFSWKEYAKGLVRPVTESNEELFWERFRIWREGVPMPEDLQNQMMRRLAEWLDFRTEGIMSANRRKCYAECAGFAAALGEVKESRGERGGKQMELLSWRARYPRRTAYHQELRRFGMYDGKR